MHRAHVGLLSCLLVLGCLAPPAAAAPRTTVQSTIQDCDGDNLLEYSFGEEHVPFGSPFDTEGCTREAGEGEKLQLPNRASIINFLQLSDFQTVDEESPGRVEFVDGSQRAPGLQPFSAAYRPQEALSAQVVESMVRQARNTTSPVTGSKLDLTILTGDNADSQQYNETRWFIDMLDGTTGSGDPDPEMETPGTSDGRDRKLDPNSGIPASTRTTRREAATRRPARSTTACATRASPAPTTATTSRTPRAAARRRRRLLAGSAPRNQAETGQRRHGARLPRAARARQRAVRVGRARDAVVHGVRQPRRAHPGQRPVTRTSARWDPRARSSTRRCTRWSPAA